MDWNGTGKKPPAEHIAFVVYNFLQRFTRETTGSWEDVVGLELDDKYPISFQPLRVFRLILSRETKGLCGIFTQCFFF